MSALTDEPEDLAKLTALVSRQLTPCRERAERDLHDATQRLESAQAQHERAAREVKAIQDAIADPRRFATLAAEFMAALNSGKDALETFLNTKEDAHLRSLVFGLRWDAERNARRGKTTDR